jgi:hypothetical protein
MNKATEWEKERNESFEAWEVGIDLFTLKLKTSGGLIE